MEQETKKKEFTNNEMESRLKMSTHSERVVAQREFKSTVFSMLFHDKKNLLELYNAVNHSHYDNPDDLRIVTLENAVFMNIRNDLAFVIDLHLNLYEHQSTYNPNMALRDLFYVASEYRKLIEKDDGSLYDSKLIRIPTPKFVVFYNGIEIRPEKEEIRLSEAFIRKEKEPDLELKVTVLNINKGNNEELLNNCRTLREYMSFVDCVREKRKQLGKSMNEAVSEAVDECIVNGILTKFLRANRAEVIEMMNEFLWNEEEKEKYKRAERRNGYEEGLQDGINLGAELLIKIQRRIAKGKSAEEIAEELETDIDTVNGIIEKLENE